MAVSNREQRRSGALAEPIRLLRPSGANRRLRSRKQGIPDRPGGTASANLLDCISQQGRDFARRQFAAQRGCRKRTAYEATMTLKDKAILIPGAGSGLGREMALTFAREGARLGINDIRPESAQNTVTEIERAAGKAGNAVSLVADVSNSAAVRKMFADFVSKFGTIDVLVNNAGIARAARFPEATGTTTLTDGEWHVMLATHLDATFFFTREALKIMIPKKSGRIVNIGSIAGTTGLAGAADYCAAKGGIISF